ncbi:hypothetical protein GBAR_LOCUS21034 [Geodia barretti]|uniref:Uncharacterized protein n=1 Tax=Geodia barretti TaxID=519541 RepID=A0AA35WYJ4_GEOBA|nr:hypothetical protein GBAR_LOCUS21034 [Geodia barretti]
MAMKMYSSSSGTLSLLIERVKLFVRSPSSKMRLPDVAV